MSTSPISLAAAAAVAAQPAQAATPADLIVDAGKSIAAAYAAYQELRLLVQLINNATDVSALPPELKIDAVTVEFRVNGVPRKVTLQTVEKIGEIYRLLTAEAAALLQRMAVQAQAAQTNAAAIQNALQAARGQA
jgi:hypothetical protein